MSAIHVLIVADLPSGRTLEESLAVRGFHCTHCPELGAALSLLDCRRFDVVIADLDGVSCSGAFIAEARKRTPQATLLVAADAADTPLALRAIPKGTDGYLLKPFEGAAVIGQIYEALHRRRLEIELEEYRQQLGEMVEQRTNELRAALESIKKTYDDTVSTLLARALDSRDHGVAPHAQRARRYSLETARSSIYCEDELTLTAPGVELPDIEKIGVLGAVVPKP